MDGLTSQELARACRIFMDLAYPDGPESIPANKRPYYHIDPNQPLEHFVPPAAMAIAVCEDLAHHSDRLHGYAFRLGSAAYPHLKLRIQFMDFHQRAVRVYAVDTHDGVVQTQQHTDEEAAIWRAKIQGNRILKHEVEESLGSTGYLTQKHLLQLDLETPMKPT